MRALFASIFAMAMLAALPGAASAADCAIDHLGKRYQAQVEIVLGDVNNPLRSWVYSGSGAPMLRYTSPNKIEVLPATIETSSATSTGFAACSNVLEVFDALAEAQRNFNQCAGFGGNVAGTNQTRMSGCEADAG